MSENEPHHRLAYLRRQMGFPTASEAARYFGWNENTYRSHENGERGLKKDVAFKYAQAFRSSANFILFGELSDDDLPTAESNFLQIVGQIKQADKAHYFNDYFDGGRSCYLAHIKTRLYPNFIGFEIEEGTYLQGIQPGSLLICLKDTSDPEEAGDKLCVVYVHGERHDTYVSRVSSRKNSDLIDIVSSAGAIRNVRPERIWQVIFIVPPGQWNGMQTQRPD